MSVQSDRLLRIAEGVWIRPRDVASVSAVKGETCVLESRKPFVRIMRENAGPDGFICGFEMLIPCETDVEAESLAETIGVMVSAAQKHDPWGLANEQS